MKTKKKKQNGAQIAVLLISVIVGGIAGALIAQFLPDMKSGENILLYAGLSILAIILATYLQIILHEAGHLVFGLLSGYEFSSFRIGNLMMIKQDGKIRCKFIKIAGTGGQCLLIPPALSNDTIPYILYGYGGCIVNVVTALLFFLLYLVVSDVIFISAFSLLSAILGVTFALLNGIPLKAGLVANDGSNVLEQRRNPESVRAMCVQLQINEQMMKGIRLRDISDNLFYMPTKEGLKHTLVATIGVFYANKLLSMGKFKEAKEAIDTLLQDDVSICGLHRNMLQCDKLYCELLEHATKEEVDYLYCKELKQFMKQMKKFPSVLRTQYAVEVLYNKNQEAGNKVLETFEKVAKSYPYQGDIADERDLLEQCNLSM